MDPRNEDDLRGRVIDAASRAVKAQGWVCSIDVLVGLGWLTQENLDAWRRGQVPFLERVVTAGLGRVSTAMRLFHAWAAQQGWKPSRTEYGPQRRPLQFSKSGNPSIETRYRTHWITRAVADQEEKRRDHQQPVKQKPEPPEERKRAEEEQEREPLVFEPHRESKCDACQKELPRRAFIRVRDRRAECMTCAGYDDLVYLPAGDPTVSRRARAASGRYAIVMRWSRTRKRYERRGLLVEPAAHAAAMKSVGRKDEFPPLDDDDRDIPF